MFELHPPHPPLRSARARRVARWFGLSSSATAPRTSAAPDAQALRELLPMAGTIRLITGPSGSGKSSLLRALRAAATRRKAPELGMRWIDLNRVHLPERPLVDCFADSDVSLQLEQVLSLLSRVGLGEAWTYLKTPAELSAGQRWRAKLAVALGESGCVVKAAGGGSTRGAAPCNRRIILCADEFGAVLDRVTAMIVARTLRRAVRPPLSALLATAHDDLAGALLPDCVIRCDFGQLVVQPACLTRTS